MKIEELKDKKIALLGFGIENKAVLKYLIKNSANDITICDKNDKLFGSSDKFSIFNFQFSNNFQLTKSKFPNIRIEYQLGEKYLKYLKEFDIIFRTPGIPYLTPEIQQAKKSGVEISSLTKLFFELCPAKIIGVTGTKGKGTTVSLITEILKSKIPCLPAGRKNQKSKIYCGGNIGNPPIEFLDKLTKNDWAVLELSSFQLQDLDKSPHIAVVLDIKEDHLDHHKDQDEYIDAKTSIVRYQNKNDFTVVNLDYLTAFKFALMSPTKDDYYFSRHKSVDLGAFIKWNKLKGNDRSGEIILRTNEGESSICTTKEVTLRGEHNLENICAAITASYLADANIKAIKEIVPKFKGLEHRLEYVTQINGVKFYNDSFSTTPDTTIAAIKSFSEPIILIVGGSEKGADYSALVKEIEKSTVKTLIAIGVTGPKIVRKLKIKNEKLKIIEDLKNMHEIIKTAYKEAEPRDIVLLSPASASFDMFKNYKDRGEQFKSATADLKKLT